jgi:hypothetical protein
VARHQLGKIRTGCSGQWRCFRGRTNWSVACLSNFPKLYLPVALSTLVRWSNAESQPANRQHTGVVGRSPTTELSGPIFDVVSTLRFRFHQPDRANQSDFRRPTANPPCTTVAPTWRAPGRGYGVEYVNSGPARPAAPDEILSESDKALLVQLRSFCSINGQRSKRRSRSLETDECVIITTYGTIRAVQGTRHNRAGSVSNDEANELLGLWGTESRTS